MLPRKEGPASLNAKKRLSQAIDRGRERAEARRAKRGGRQSWVVRKLAVGIVLGLMCYTYYVYVATFCVSMIRREDSALGSKSTGIALLIVFNVLWLLLAWSYGKAVLTPPGYAAQCVPHSGPPVADSTRPAWPPTPTDTEGDSIAGPPYDSFHPPSRVADVDAGQSIRLERTGSKAGPGTREEARPTDAIPVPAKAKASNSNTEKSKDSPSVPTTMSSRTGPTHTSTQTQSQSQSQSLPQSPLSARLSGSGRSRNSVPVISSNSNANTGYDNSDLPPPAFSRRPPTHPVLAAEYRYCSRDGILKPWRTHHCRACGTCVLRYDHHCPWIGQCVGARNHKFFLNFLFWSTIFSLYACLSLVIFVATHTSNPSVPNPQHIVIIALAGFFTIFTFVLGLSQARLILINMTTVEQLNANRMKEGENAMLGDLLPCACFGLEVCCGEGILCSCFGDGGDDRGMRRRWEEGMPDVEGVRTPCGTVRARRSLQKQWDWEWGRLEIEGNLWWAGSASNNWKQVMGNNWWSWILPIGRSPGDGMTFPRNPRFDEEGRWRRRRDWPEELRAREPENV